MKTRRAALVVAVLIAALAIHYAPRMDRPGAITFGLIQDISSIYGFYPWDTFSLHEIKAGFFPLWNPHNALGEPHLANMQTAIFYPITWLKFLFGMNLWALDALLLFRLFLAGACTYLFARRLNLNFTASIVSSISFMLTGYLTRHIYMSHLNVEILIPLVALTFYEMGQTGKLKWFAASAAAVWLSIIGGFPEATVYCLSLAGLFFLWTAHYKRWPLLIGATFCGFVASGVQTLPFFEYVANAWFYHPPGIGFEHLDIKYFFTLWAPWFFGVNNVSPLAPFLMPYLGAVPMTLALCALGKKMDKQRWFFALAAVICFGLIYGIPPFSWLAYLPIFDLTLNYKYAIPPAAFCVAMLAGYGAENLLDGMVSRKIVIVSVALLLIVFAAYILDIFGFFRPFHRILDLKFSAISLLPAIALIIISIANPEKYNKSASIILVIISICLPVGGNTSKYINPFDTKSLPGEGGLLPRSYDECRFTAQDGIYFPNTNLTLLRNDLRYYNPMYVNSYKNLIFNINEFKDENELRQHFADHSMLAPESEKMTSIWLDYAAVNRWIGNTPPGAIDLLPNLLSLADWRAAQQNMIVEIPIETEDIYAPAILAHAPAEIRAAVTVPNDASLRFIPMFLPKAGNCSDGVFFTIALDSNNARKTVFSEFLVPGDKEKEHTFSLDEYSGKKVNLIFSTTPGPSGNIDCDMSAWVAPSLGNMNPNGWERWTDFSNRAWKRSQESQWSWSDGSCESGKITVDRTSSQKFDVVSPRCESGSTVVSYGYYPGWKAYSRYSNFQEVKIGKWKGIFQSVEGGGAFQFIYQPVSFKIGLWFTISSSLIMFSIIFFRWYNTAAK